jgi:hypothetical protein
MSISAGEEISEIDYHVKTEMLGNAIELVVAKSRG